MREGTHTPVFVKNEENDFFSVHMPADFCAEHENGVKTIETELGIPNISLSQTQAPFDVSRFQMTRFEVGNLYFHTTPRTAQLMYDSELTCRNPSFFEQRYKTEESREKFPEDPGFQKMPVRSYGEWCSKGFLIYTNTVLGVNCLKELYAAFLENKVAVYGGNKNVFKSVGLNLLIVPKTPQVVLDTISNSLEQIRKLHAKAEEYPIYNQLKKRIFTIFPQWSNKEETEVRFYVSTWGREFTSGWYSPEELESLSEQLV